MIVKEIKYTFEGREIIGITIGSIKRKENIYREYSVTEIRLRRIKKAVEAMENAGCTCTVSWPYKDMYIIVSV
jgi:hypothetical protein